MGLFNKKGDSNNNEYKKRLEAASLQFTSEQIDRLSKLPVRTIRYANSIYRCLYDEENLILYTLDEKNIPTTETIKLKKPLKKQEENRKDVNTNTDESSDKDTNSKGQDSSDTTNAAEANQKNGSKKRTFVFFVLYSLLLIAGTAALFFTFFSNREASPSYSDAASIKTTVVMTTRTILPGETIHLSDVEAVNISNETYNAVSMSGESIYLWDSADEIDGMFATRYISSGSYLTVSSVSGSEYDETNPFRHTSSSQNVLFEIPVNLTYDKLSSVQIGRFMDMEIHKVVSSNSHKQVEVDEVDGLTHSKHITESTTTDTYILPNTAILDMVNANGTSMYSVLSKYNAIPDGELVSYMDAYMGLIAEQGLLEGKTTASILYPEFFVTKIVIELPKEQAKAITGLTSENTQLILSNLSNEYMMENELEINFRRESPFTIDTIVALVNKYAAK